MRCYKSIPIKSFSRVSTVHNLRKCHWMSLSTRSYAFHRSTDDQQPSRRLSSSWWIWPPVIPFGCGEQREEKWLGPTVLTHSRTTAHLFPGSRKSKQTEVKGLSQGWIFVPSTPTPDPVCSPYSTLVGLSAHSPVLDFESSNTSLSWVWLTYSDCENHDPLLILILIKNKMSS